MFMKIGDEFEHLRTKVRFAVRDMFIHDNEIEGGINIKVRVVTETDSVYVFGMTQLERMWPNLKRVSFVGDDGTVELVDNGEDK